MKFKRINVDTVRCIISESELNENGLEMDDFLANNGKTEDFLRKIISMAEQEVGFKVQGGPMTVQVAVLPENALALTFSEKQGGGIMELLESLKSAVSNLSDSIDTDKNEPAAEKKKTHAPAPALPKGEKEVYILSFQDMKEMERFCNRIPRESVVDSSLYYLKEDETFYLLVWKEDENKNKLCQVLSASIEFMDAVSSDPRHKAYIEEHGSCIIKKNALLTVHKLIEKKEKADKKDIDKTFTN